ncbi:hypothetical protein AMELA_G00025280 [Ameiurus melas]|uniref:Uncharacterized protein n=1 Tax=Ameiurus melas TaxID=219545 RepID=A0A7J6BGG2_AMEME|nr:hypothetical protein AMELA_G00025280 [Ameiurus melas]
MKTFLSTFGAGVVDVPLRPLLYMTGAAAMAAAINCYVKRGYQEKTTPENEVTAGDPVCEKAMELANIQPTEVPQDQVMNAAAEAEEKIQKLVVSNTQLEDRVRELEQLLCEARRDCDMKSKVSLAEAEEKHQKAVETIDELEVEKSNLNIQVEMLRGSVQDMVVLLHVIERQSDQLKNEFQMKEDYMKKSVTQTVELLKFSLAEAEEKHQEAVETIDQLEVEKSNLKHQVEELQGTVLDMGKVLTEIERECEKLINVSRAEADEKHQKAVETIAQLEVEKSELKHQVEGLQGRVQEMETVLHKTYRWSSDLMNDVERERETHSILKSEYDEMKETLMDKEELLKVCLAEAEEKHQKAVETIDQLEMEKSDLRNQKHGIPLGSKKAVRTGMDPQKNQHDGGMRGENKRKETNNVM